jgi:hypothetical protein
VNYTLDPGLPVTRLQCHPLILDGSASPATLESAQADSKCACTFYLVFKEPDFLAPPSGYFVVRGTLQSYEKPSLAVNTQPFCRRNIVPDERLFDGARAMWELRALRRLRRLSPPARSRSVSTNIRVAGPHCQPRPFRSRRLALPDARSRSIGVTNAASKRGRKPRLSSCCCSAESVELRSPIPS